MLSGFGLEFVGRFEVEQRRHVDRERAVARLLVAHLANRLEEGLALDVADRAADFHNQDIHAGALGQATDALLDQVGDVGHGLDRPAQIVAATLTLDHIGGDLAHCDGGCGGQVLVEEAFVVAQVEVGLGTVVGDVDLAVLIGRHRAGVDVEVGVKFLNGDREAARLEESSK